jgi:hypothetical protein
MGKKKKARERKRPARSRNGPLIGGLVVFIIAGLLAWGWVSSRGPKRGSSGDLTATAGYIRRETRTPLSAALFVGQTARAYQVAQEIPEVLDQLYCYCECDKHMGHKSLLSCFADSHGAT